MIWHMAGLPDIPSPRDRSEQPARVQVLTPGSGLLFAERNSELFSSRTLRNYLKRHIARKRPARRRDFDRARGRAAWYLSPDVGVRLDDESCRNAVKRHG